MQVSLFASAIRPKLWPAFLQSLDNTSIDWEVVFAGTCNEIKKFEFNYINTKNIKPAQCYEIARRNCTGEVVVWVADDCEFPNDVIGKAYKYWKLCNNDKLILSLQTKETGYNCPEGQLFDMNIHRFFGAAPVEPYNPLMAPIGMMSRKFLNDLGGIDRRYICGQYENDIVMRAMSQGAIVEIFGGSECFVDIDHLGKSLQIGESQTEYDFLNRPFAKGYNHDRTILENSWTKTEMGKLLDLLQTGRRTFSPTEFKEISKVQLDTFEPYEDTDILTTSQSYKGQWK